MKILFGGTFDPIHIGHIRLALHIHHQFQHKVTLLPLGGIPDYKPVPQTSLTERLSMLKIMVDKYPEVLDIDYSEANLDTYSPSYLTLRRLRQIYGPDEAIYFIIGGDSLLTLDTWHNWHELFELTNFIVAMRPDYPISQMSNMLSQIVTPKLSGKINYHLPHGQIILTNWTPLEVSSTQIRQSCKNGLAIENLVEPEINHYISNHNLYKKEL